MNDSTPKISCVMVTRGKTNLIKKSIDCYFNQTYPNKELVILSQAEDNQWLRKYLSLSPSRDIQFLEISPKKSLGALRNLSVEIATGSIVCQWDDDDLYHPCRLATQYHALNHTGVVATLYTQFLKYYKQDRKLYWADWTEEKDFCNGFLSGSIMFDKDAFYFLDNQLYPESGDLSRLEEDLTAVERLVRVGRIGGIKEGWQYIYVFHGDNIYDEAHHRMILKTGWEKKILGEDQLVLHKEQLFRALDSVKMDQPIDVCSLEGKVYEYGSRLE
jgi:glycosyltransferase involved in cell wall biosynthesis